MSLLNNEQVTERTLLSAETSHWKVTLELWKKPLKGHSWTLKQTTERSFLNSETSHRKVIFEFWTSHRMATLELWTSHWMATLQQASEKHSWALNKSLKVTPGLKQTIVKPLLYSETSHSKVTLEPWTSHWKAFLNSETSYWKAFLNSETSHWKALLNSETSHWTQRLKNPWFKTYKRSNMKHSKERERKRKNVMW